MANRDFTVHEVNAVRSDNKIVFNTSKVRELLKSQAYNPSNNLLDVLIRIFQFTAKSVLSNCHHSLAL